MIAVETGHFTSDDEGEASVGASSEMLGATFSSSEGELFTVLIDAKPDEYVIQLDTPGKGRGLELIEARPGYVLLSVPRDESGALAEVCPFPPLRAW